MSITNAKISKRNGDKKGQQVTKESNEHEPELLAGVDDDVRNFSIQSIK